MYVHINEHNRQMTALEVMIWV